MTSTLNNLTNHTPFLASFQLNSNKYYIFRNQIYQDGWAKSQLSKLDQFDVSFSYIPIYYFLKGVMAKMP